MNGLDNLLSNKNHLMPLIFPQSRICTILLGNLTYLLEIVKIIMVNLLIHMYLTNYSFELII